MDNNDTSTADIHLSPETTTTTTTSHHLKPPPGLTQQQFIHLKSTIIEFHTYNINTTTQCSSLLGQHINAPPDIVWSVIRRFDKPQTYKHFIKSCHVQEGSQIVQGCTRDVVVISGLPADTSTERLDLLDDEKRVMAFSIIGGEHRLKNYRAVTTVHEISNTETIVLESYVVDVPEGNTEEDTRFFSDTIVKLNLQKLASVTQDIARSSGATGRESL
ncbi:abscisic acid receptor PYR1-like [Rutidosis leptorrhynchoides]|uniref:abscisic acid receptor PYR1-like n=1 Tax=Rutidosis leptorrhynchoides TaxID=125765 RepID=UPI003A9A4EDA